MDYLKYTFGLLLLFFTAGCADNTAVADTDWPEITADAKPWTRWWWMGSAVDKNNLTYNLEAMSQAGIGGVEITPIYGVKGAEDNFLSYLSPQWMDMLSHTEAEARRLSMGVDMNTGTGWPFGGPDVSVEDAATKAIFQEYMLRGVSKLNKKIEVEDERQKAVARLDCLMAYAEDGEKVDITEHVTSAGELAWQAPDQREWKLIALFIGKTFQQVKRAAPGGEGLVMDHLDAGAVRRYLGKYDKAFSSAGILYPHSFFNDSYEVYGADWTPSMRKEFFERRGYKLEEYFPELLADGATEESARVISDFRETVGEILKDNFSRVWTEWAHEHGSITRNQAHGSPANLIDIYASVDIPECETFGISDFDIPYLRKDTLRKENDGDPTTLKYASSAAHITGKRYTSSETFTWLTEHFRTSLSQCKPEIDQMFLSGVNRVFFHGSTYSPKEAEWPGWLFYASVNMSPTNSLWRDASAFFQYIARVQSFLQQGEPDNDFLLYMPIYDIWNEQRGNYFLTFSIHGMRDRLPEFYRAVENVRSSGYDLDYISDYFIQTTTVENGLLKTEGGATYKALILPASRLIPLKTLKKVKELAAAGAKVVFAERYPEDVPGLYDLENRRNKFHELMEQFPKVESFRKVLTTSMVKGSLITGRDYAGILSATGVQPEPYFNQFNGDYLRRKHDDGHIYFLSMLRNKQIDGWVPLAVKAKSAMLFNPMTGEKGKARIRQVNHTTEVYLQIQPGESFILKTYTAKNVNEDEWIYYASAGNTKELIGPWEVSFIDSDPVLEETFTLTNLISWTELNNPALQVNRGTAHYKTTIEMPANSGNEYRLLLGDVRESARIFVNGTEAGVVFAPPFELNIGKYLKSGENMIEIEVTNLPANRIADYDRQGKEWRIFHEINIVNLEYKSEPYGHWQPVPSGLLGPVTLQEMKPI